MCSSTGQHATSQSAATGRLRHRVRSEAGGNGATGPAQQKTSQRGVVILPGLGNSAADYAAIAADLKVTRAVLRRTCVVLCAMLLVVAPNSLWNIADINIPFIINLRTRTHFLLPLQERGLAVEVARVSRPDWLRNAAGLTDISYWRGTLQPRPTVNW